MTLDKVLKNSQSYFTKKDKELKLNWTKQKAMVTINYQHTNGTQKLRVTTFRADLICFHPSVIKPTDTCVRYKPHNWFY